MAKEMTDAQMLRKLKREVKVIVRRHMDTMEQRDALIEVIEAMISAFCPSPEWDGNQIRQWADNAITNARRGIDP